MRIILDVDKEQNFIDLWNPEKNKWERYIKCEEKDKKIEKFPTNNGMLYATDGEMTLVVNKINEIIDKINKMEDNK